ncbi:threonylcarbamoyl-AMP synthase [Phreatobacter aquaticus]|uniref:Threonylcarbamoyl-AMP synthase n=1 Tax=Phreatobacter aquaticus TaxID=2570229 RepID=A0A4D7QHK3_9HYPH|nr:L-threonylcarbamoyladenylate synthase [Phreatobacter aquaticus]QCK86385.1 threonylcarbamoyl-AMP synthase [Phreatobacter aquaticus]
MHTRITRHLIADADGLAEAAALLRAGGLVAFPTETVYGLGADATDGRAVAGIYEAKGRPSFNPLIAHVASPEAAFALGPFDAHATALAKAFWPGPLTLVVPVGDDSPVSDLARAGLSSVGLRVPSHPVAQALLALVDRPVAGPSANRSGHVSPTDAAHVLADLDGRIDAVLDAGPTAVGVESTIVGCLGGAPVLLRPGGVTRAEMEAVLGVALGEPVSEATIAPGMLASHYAPNAAVRLDATEVRPGEALLAFGPALPCDGPVLNLSVSGDLSEAAANLFGHLRRLDAEGATAIAVMPIPAEGLGEAIRDRLKRAAAPRV